MARLERWQRHRRQGRADGWRPRGGAASVGHIAGFRDPLIAVVISRSRRRSSRACCFGPIHPRASWDVVLVHRSVQVRGSSILGARRPFSGGAGELRAALRKSEGAWRAEGGPSAGESAPCIPLAPLGRPKEPRWSGGLVPRDKPPALATPAIGRAAVARDLCGNPGFQPAPVTGEDLPQLGYLPRRGRFVPRRWLGYAPSPRCAGHSPSDEVSAPRVRRLSSSALFLSAHPIVLFQRVQAGLLPGITGRWSRAAGRGRQSSA